MDLRNLSGVLRRLRVPTQLLTHAPGGWLTMRCSEKARLLKNYRDCSAGYLRIVRRMKLRTRNPFLDFSALRKAAFDSLKEVERAQRLLQRHFTEHHC